MFFCIAFFVEAFLKVAGICAYLWAVLRVPGLVLGLVLSFKVCVLKFYKLAFLRLFSLGSGLV